MSSDDEKTRIIATGGTIAAGTQLNGIYEVEERIAEGGMGEVYRGRNIQTDDLVAIKVVLPEHARDQKILALFRKEATILPRLSHDAIVRYHVFTVDPGINRHYLAMEFVDGESLAEHLKHGPLDSETARRLVLRVASGLAAAHEAGVIHRDLSPDNIILPGGNPNKAKIIDFGIAKSTTIGGGTLIGSGFAGKYNFVSPEQLGDFGGEITGRSDIYSLGLVFAAALRGQPLDMGSTPVEAIDRRRGIPDISGLDPVLLPVVEAMLQPNPEHRPPSMDAVVMMLSTPTDAAVYAQGVASGERPVGYISSVSPRASIPPTSIHPLTPPPAAAAQSPGSQAPGSQAPRSAPPFAPVGSTPPPSAYAGSAPPPAYAGSTPPAPYGGSAPAFSNPPSHHPYGGSTPPASESPFGPGPSVPPPPSFQSLPPQPAQPVPARTSRGGLLAGLAALVLVAGAGGLYLSGVLDGVLGGPPAGTGAPPPDLTPPAQEEAAPPQAEEAPGPEAGQPAQPQPEEHAEQPPARPGQAQEPPLDTAASWVEWLATYDGGACFYVTATSVSDTALEVEGFATTAAPFETLMAAFKQDYGIEPQIGARLIEPEQCAVADFLHTLRGSSGDRPELTLSSDVIGSGDPIQGSLGNLENRSTAILLIDNKGVVYNLASHVRQASGGGSFNIRLGLDTPVPVPQVIIAIASREELKAANVSEPVLAETLFPRLLEEIRSTNSDAAATAKYFRLGG